MKILLLNQNATVEKLITLSVQKIGSEIEKCVNLDGVDSDDFDIVIIDHEVLDEIDLDAAKSRFSEAKFFLLQPKDGLGKVEGFDYYVDKPFLPTELVETLSSILSGGSTEEPSMDDDGGMDELDGLGDMDLDDMLDVDSGSDLEDLDTMGDDVSASGDAFGEDELNMDDLDLGGDAMQEDLGDLDDLDLSDLDDKPSNAKTAAAEDDGLLEDDLDFGDLEIDEEDVVKGSEPSSGLDDDLDFDLEEESLGDDAGESAESDLGEMDFDEMMAEKKSAQSEEKNELDDLDFGSLEEDLDLEDETVGDDLNLEEEELGGDLGEEEIDLGEESESEASKEFDELEDIELEEGMGDLDIEDLEDETSVLSGEDVDEVKELLEETEESEDLEMEGDVDLSDFGDESDEEMRFDLGENSGLIEEDEDDVDMDIENELEGGSSFDEVKNALDEVESMDTGEAFEEEEELSTLSEANVAEALGEEFEAPASAAKERVSVQSTIAPQVAQDTVAAITKSVTQAVSSIPVENMKELLDGMELTIKFSFPDKKK